MKKAVFILALFLTGCDGQSEASLTVNAPSQTVQSPSQPAKKEEEEGVDKDGCCKQVTGD